MSRKEGARIILFRCRKNEYSSYALVSLVDDVGKERSVAIPSGVQASGWSNIQQGILEVVGARGRVVLVTCAPTLANSEASPSLGDDLESLILADVPRIARDCFRWGNARNQDSVW